jgi:hypothetical protein
LTAKFLGRGLNPQPKNNPPKGGGVNTNQRHPRDNFAFNSASGARLASVPARTIIKNAFFTNEMLPIYAIPVEFQTSIENYGNATGIVSVCGVLL